MLNKKIIINQEKKILEEFFNKKFPNLPNLPAWITNNLIQYWNKNIFHIHYLPKISLDKNLNLPLWKDKPSKTFYKKIQENKLKKEAKTLPGKWILIDGRNKPKKKVAWVRSKEVWFLKKIGLNPKKYFKKWQKQLHQHEYLINILKEKGFGSRFCLTISDINALKPFILKFLKINPQKNIRLPFFIEYNYFGNAIYKQWQTTETWEWFEDRFGQNQHLAGGGNDVRSIGWEPSEFWSTILTFRPIIEL